MQTNDAGSSTEALAADAQKSEHAVGTRLSSLPPFAGVQLAHEWARRKKHDC